MRLVISWQIVYFLYRSATLSSCDTGTFIFSMWSRSSKQEDRGRIQCYKESWRKQTCHQNRVNSWSSLTAGMAFSERQLPWRSVTGCVLASSVCLSYTDHVTGFYFIFIFIFCDLYLKNLSIRTDAVLPNLACRLSSMSWLKWIEIFLVS